MSNPIRPATDEEIAAWRLSVPIKPVYGKVWTCKGCGVYWDADQNESIPHSKHCLSEFGPRIIARIESDRATIAEQAKRIRVLEAQNLTYRLADNPATVEAFQSEMEEAEATIADLRALRAGQEDAHRAECQRIGSENAALRATVAEQAHLLAEAIKASKADAATIAELRRLESALPAALSDVQHEPWCDKRCDCGGARK